MEQENAMVQCEDCGMPEREEWARLDKHICNTITDPNYPAISGETYRIGKKRFVKII